MFLVIITSGSCIASEVPDRKELDKIAILTCQLRLSEQRETPPSSFPIATECAIKAQS